MKRIATWLQGRLPAKLLALASALALWQAMIAAGVLSADAVASPPQVAQALVQLVGEGAFWGALGDTLQSWALGLALSALIAIPLGLLLGSSDVLYRSTRFSIDFFRTIPPVALVPLLLLLYGASSRTVVTLIVIGAVWPVLLQSMYGVHQVDPVARDVARSYRLSLRDTVWRLILPSAAPFIFTGLRIAATMSLLMAVGGELIAGAPGLGEAIGAAQGNGDVPNMYAYILASAALGIVINRAMKHIERKLLSWHPSQRGAVP